MRREYSGRRRGYIEEAASNDRWLVSYSDLVTLLFAFFVVLFASAYRDNHAIVNVSSSIHHGFQALGAFSGHEDKTTLSNANRPAEGVVSPPQNQAAPPPAAAPGSVVSGPDLNELQRQLQAALGNELKNHEVVLQITSEGFVISLKELGFFDSGKADLLPGAAAKLERIAKILSEHGLELRVEGHSDNQPIHTAQFPSNWDLSTARAMTVLLLLVNDGGYNPGKISAAGFGQYHPIADDTTPEGRRENRRVDLVVLGTAPSLPTAAK